MKWMPTAIWSTSPPSSPTPRTTERIPGWSHRTRQLGTYIVSDTELDVTVDEPETSEPADVETPTNNGKDIPNTGSSDMVNVALVAAVVSLAAAGAVAFRKVK